MQKFRMLQGQENVKNSREAINENFISVASNFAGDAFPTSNLYVGMKFYHTGEQKTYTLRQLDPVRWDEDASGRLKKARNISLTGKVQSATVGFDGTADIAIQVTRVEADVCNGNAASATVAASVKGAISSQNAPRHVWFSGANSEAQREYANNFVYNPVTGTLAVPQVEGTASLASRAFTADRAGADGNGANIAATYVPKNGAGAGGTWGINIGGRAAVANVADRVGNDAADMRFHWDGRGGQPPWVWGSDNPYDMRVYNPSNFNVNHANTANSAGRADTAGRADSAARADNAESAKRADTASYTSGYAEKAKRADGAGRSDRAGYADNAGSAGSADRAKTAGWADGAQRAKSAERADGAGWADNAGHANRANNSDRAEVSSKADTAITLGGSTLYAILRKLGGHDMPTLTPLVDWDRMKQLNGGNDVRNIRNYDTGIIAYGGDNDFYGFPKGTIFLTQSYKAFDAIFVFISNDEGHYNMSQLFETWRLDFMFQNSWRFNLATQGNVFWHVYGNKRGAQNAPHSTETIWQRQDQNCGIIEIYGINY